jgi:hypothetical protein
MSIVQISDELYIAAQEYLGPIAFEKQQLGLGPAFERWLRKRDPGIAPAEIRRLEGYMRALFDYSEGKYPAGQDWSDEKTVVWSFHRAWIDRFGWTVGTPGPES